MRRNKQAIALLLLLAACGVDGVTESLSNRHATRQAVVPAANRALGAAVEQDLAALRQATAAFHDFDVARAAHWGTPITPCMTDPAGAGGMGFHYGNTDLIDGPVQVDKPELLLYEPEKNGRLRLVAVEYIIPYTFHSRDAEPPVLFNQQFRRNDTFQLWGLHAWVWAENPSGMFANWNPRITCDNAASAVRMSH